MNTPMIKHLILKDWHFNRVTISVCIVVGAIALLIIGTGGKSAFYVGSVLFITVLIGLGITLTIMTVIHERTEQTLPFVMSLPISVMEYTTAKILWMLSTEFVVLLVILGLTFYFQARKKDFL